MKSGKQRRAEIKERRRKKADPYKELDRFDLGCKPASAILANIEELQHNPRAAYTLMPLFYVDMPFTCKDCGSKELCAYSAETDHPLPRVISLGRNAQELSRLGSSLETLPKVCMVNGFKLRGI